MSKPLSIAILISGRGSNMQKLVETAEQLGVNVALVAADKDAAGITWAQEKGLHTEVFLPKALGGRRPFQETALANAILNAHVDYVFLAGYMAVLSADFIDNFTSKIINIHPSILPKYKGLNTYQRALDNGDAEHGASVHLVTPALDDGPVLLQAVLEIVPSDTAESLADRTLREEHILYPAILRSLASGALSIKDGKGIWDKTALDELEATFPNLRICN